MRLTPLDIRKQEFKKAMRGLDPEEVHAFLTTIADEYEAVLNDNKALRERLLELDDKVQEYRNMEKTLRDTLLTAERATSEAKDNARREAELIIKQAEIDAEKGVRDIKENALKLRQEIQSLRRQRDSYLARMKMLAESHMKFLESSESDFREDDDRLTEVERRVSRRVEDTSGISRTREQGGPPPRRSAAPTPPAAPRTAPPRAPETPRPPAADPSLRDLDKGKAAGDTARATMTMEEAEVPLGDLLNRVIEGHKAILDEVAASEMPVDSRWTPDKEPSEKPDRPTQEAPIAEPLEKVEALEKKPMWSLERLRGEIAGDAGIKDETD
jgi:cell division initiation protein